VRNQLTGEVEIMSERYFGDICDELRKHPDYRGAVIWQRADIEDVAADMGVDADVLDEEVDMSAWEGLATSDGFDFTLYQVASEISERETETN